MTILHPYWLQIAMNIQHDQFHEWMACMSNLTVCWIKERDVFVYRCVCVCSPRISPPPRSPHCAVLCQPALSSSDRTFWASSPLHHSPLQLREREICVKHLWNKHFPLSVYRATALSAYSQHETPHSNNVTYFRMKWTKRKCRESWKMKEDESSLLPLNRLSKSHSQQSF